MAKLTIEEVKAQFPGALEVIEDYKQVLGEGFVYRTRKGILYAVPTSGSSFGWSPDQKRWYTVAKL
jgi:hypothetical protein